VVGRAEGLGRPLLYGTTPLFLELLGLRDLSDLPRAEELSVALVPHQPLDAEHAEEASVALPSDG
jgi:segregation and condensation protein B